MGFLKILKSARTNFFVSTCPPVRPNSTQAVAAVHSKRTLKMMRSEIVGIAEFPRLT